VVFFVSSDLPRTYLHPCADFFLSALHSPFHSAPLSFTINLFPSILYSVPVPPSSLTQTLTLCQSPSLFSLPFSFRHIIPHHISPSLHFLPVPPSLLSSPLPPSLLYLLSPALPYLLLSPILLKVDLIDDPAKVLEDLSLLGQRIESLTQQAKTYTGYQKMFGVSPAP
jgi:hypothetical protein